MTFSFAQPMQPKSTARRLGRQLLAASLAWLSLGPMVAIAQVEPEIIDEEEEIVINNTGTATYQVDDGGVIVVTASNLLRINTLIDPLGRIVGCDGELLDDYSGFSVALYEAVGETGAETGPLLQLPDLDETDSQTRVILASRNVNPENNNPFLLGETPNLPPKFAGQFNFVLSEDQIRVGAAYILEINPPQNLFLDPRRIRIEITSVVADSFSYRATSLDGLPLSIGDDAPLSEEVILQKAAEDELIAFAFPVGDITPVCQNNGIRISKTGDRATVEPGGFVIYRLNIENLTTTTLQDVVITDRLPLGFNLLEDSVQAELGGEPTPVTTETNGRLVTFTFAEPFPGGTPPSNNPAAVVVYVAEVTPDALRGDGRNAAFVNGDREDNGFDVSDGPDIYGVGIRNGLISDLGTIIGRVFEDKNFDGEQQYGEPGIPNAVIFMQNGNRVVTDENGLFSISNVLPGWHVGVLDFTSVPGYTLAPGPLFRNESQSRSVRLEPGGMARLNFAVTPYTEEAKE
ncbi:hypothetical protein AWQ21_11005 [Picosynechococcus sp. PCC 7003]|uniref:DUF11 domain-containing protein n=1 Tax=Picosynechococcus sp. PCC 7003 TaxID=374981 RepID=UPI000810EA21|nr:DUF11 domain-containing protein [Picosynechococcus sp. PCC 7003]ANV84860.1 hypothetical protein AWQ21_11005 [Picosynechococcus sp. PCC 7003]